MCIEPHWLSSALALANIWARAASIAATGVLAAAYCSTAAAQTSDESASVYEFVEAYQNTINMHDPAALAAFFTEDADLVMFNLPEVRGRQAIENWWRDFWQSRFNRQETGRRATITVKSIRFPADDVSIANIETTTGGQDSQGVELQSRNARGTWLLHRQDGHWLISAMRGMLTENDSIELGASIDTAESQRPHIRAFVEDYERAFNNHDSSAVSAFFRPDADIVVRNGPLIQGRQSIQKWWSDYFSQSRNYRALFIVDEIKTIDEAVVLVNLTVTGAIPGTENELQPLRQTRAMWILVRDTDKWLISALRVLPSLEDQIIRASDR